MEQSNATKIRLGTFRHEGYLSYGRVTLWAEDTLEGWECRWGDADYEGKTYRMMAISNSTTATYALQKAEATLNWGGNFWTRARGALGACRRVDAERARNVTMAAKD